MMTVNTTIHQAPKLRCQSAEPGEGYRLLEPYEVIERNDEALSEAGRGWRREASKAGLRLDPCWRPRRRKLRTTEELYNELLYAVVGKWEGETRHQTALRYIRETEARITVEIATILGGDTKNLTNKVEHEGW
jgi:hypothetical protein